MATMQQLESSDMNFTPSDNIIMAQVAKENTSNEKTMTIRVCQKSQSQLTLEMNIPPEADGDKLFNLAPQQPSPIVPTVPYHDMYKIVIVGPPNGGKSALVHSFCTNDFLLEHNPTLGIDLKVRDVELNGQKIKLKLWDTSGEQRFRHVVTSYCRTAETAGVAVVFDVTDIESFNAAKNWIALLDELASTANAAKGWNPVKILVGNKDDMIVQRTVSKYLGERLAIENKYLYIETSAKSGRNVEECFLCLSTRIKSAKEKELNDRREVQKGLVRTYGANISLPNPDDESKYAKMNKVIEEFEHSQYVRDVNSSSANTSSVSIIDEQNCGCLPKGNRNSSGRPTTRRCCIL